MKKPRPIGGMEIPVSSEDWSKLVMAEIHSGFTLEAWEIASQAVHDWLARHSPETLAKPCTTGYQWKELFLPKGTLLRTVFNGRHHHCFVEEDGPRFNGQATSPSRFANAVGGVRRNAWRVIWVLSPNTTDWKLADSLRTRRRAPNRPPAGRHAGPRAGEAKAQPGHAEERRHREPECVPAPARTQAPAHEARPVRGQARPRDSNVQVREQRRAPPERRVAPAERRRRQAPDSETRLGTARRGDAGAAPAAALKLASYYPSPGPVAVTWHAAWPSGLPARVPPVPPPQ